MSEKGFLVNNILIIYFFLIRNKENQPSNEELLHAYKIISPVPILLLISAMVAENILSHNFDLNFLVSAIAYVIVMLGIPLAILSSLILLVGGLKLITQGRVKKNNSLRFYISFISSGIPTLILLLILIYINFSNPTSFPPLK